jgi:glyoxylate carboligase
VARIVDLLLLDCTVGVGCATIVDMLQALRTAGRGQCWRRQWSADCRARARAEKDLMFIDIPITESWRSHCCQVAKLSYPRPWLPV